MSADVVGVRAERSCFEYMWRTIRDAVPQLLPLTADFPWHLDGVALRHVDAESRAGTVVDLIREVRVVIGPHEFLSPFELRAPERRSRGMPRALCARGSRRPCTVLI
jgi:hypothetical protein